MLKQWLPLLLASITLLSPVASAASSSASANTKSTDTKTTSTSSKTSSHSSSSGSSSSSSSSNTTTRTSASPYLPSSTHFLVVGAAGQFPIAASVLSYNSTATTYIVTAANKVYSPKATLTVGPSTWSYHQVDEIGNVYNTNCNLEGTTSASCYLYIGLPGGGPVFDKTILTNAEQFSSYLSIAPVQIVTKLPTGPKWSTSTAAAETRMKHPERTAGAVAAAGLLAAQMLL